MDDVIRAVSLISSGLQAGKPAQAMAQINLKNHDEKVAFKYGTLSLLAADEGNREDARYYNRIYRRLLRRLN